MRRVPPAIATRPVPPHRPRRAVLAPMAGLLLAAAGLLAAAPALAASSPALLQPPGEGGPSSRPAPGQPGPGPGRERPGPAPRPSPSWPPPDPPGSRVRVQTPWTWPIDPPVTIVRYFDPPPRPWLPGHRGVDLAAGGGMAVRAAGSGVVTFADKLVDRGVVVIQHQGLRTTYEPVKAVVEVGEGVWPGKLIGQVSPDGGHCATRGCLHWGLLRGSAYLDPLLLLGTGRVMLVPP